MCPKPKLCVGDVRSISKANLVRAQTRLSFLKLHELATFPSRSANVTYKILIDAMSRALEDGTVASVRIDTDSSLVIYEDIVKALCPDPASGLLEIEFLGESHALPPGCNLLQDGNSIGIPKKKLVQAFVVARTILFKNLEDFSDDKHHMLRQAAAVILLMDPEHLTAANTRKRIVRGSQPHPTSLLQQRLDEELVFTDSLLASPLKRHSKSPTLWAHRRWLLSIYQVTGLAYDIQRDLKSVVLISAERHPRNYYAWSHLRWLLETFGGRENVWRREGTSGLGRLAHSELTSIVLDWCLRHSDDTSGLSFLLFLLFSDDSSALESRSVCDDILRLTASFHWTNESIWVFLRNLVASGLVSKVQRTSFLQTLQSSMEALPEGSHAQKVLLSSKSWVRDHEVAP